MLLYANDVYITAMFVYLVLLYANDVYITAMLGYSVTVH